MKKILSLILALVLCLSLSACGQKEEIIELTTNNISDYQSFSKSISGGSVEKGTKNVLGISLTSYEGTGTYTLEAARKDNVGFKDVTVELDIIVGHGYTMEAWNFVSGGKPAPKYSDDNGRFAKTVKMNISYDGSGKISEEMVLDELMPLGVVMSAPGNLSTAVTYEIVSVTGSVVITK